MTKSPLKDDVLGLIPISSYSSTAKGEFVSLCESDKVVDWLENNPDIGDKAQRAILERVGEEDNPVVVIIE